MVLVSSVVGFDLIWLTRFGYDQSVYGRVSGLKSHWFVGWLAKSPDRLAASIGDQRCKIDDEHSQRDQNRLS